MTEQEHDPDEPGTVGRALVTELRTQTVVLWRIRRALLVLAGACAVLALVGVVALARFW
jgi:phage host-nuclease inhibitor protein Gam